MKWMWKQKRMGGDTYIEKVSYYGALFFDSLNCLANKSRVSQKQSNGGCPRDMLLTQPIMYLIIKGVMRGCEYIFSCGLLRCSTLRDGLCETPKRVGRATGTATHTFLLYVPRTITWHKPLRGLLRGRFLLLTWKDLLTLLCYYLCNRWWQTYLRVSERKKKWEWRH